MGSKWLKYFEAIDLQVCKAVRICQAFKAMAILRILTSWTLGLAVAVRMESETVAVEVVDCEELEPAPEKAKLVWRQFSEDKAFVDEGKLRHNVYKWHAKGIKYDDCSKYFMYWQKYDCFVALKQHQGLHMCYNPESKICKTPKGGKIWNYAVKAVPEKCKAELCHIAETGEWKAKKKSWLSWAKKKKPWPRTLPGHKGIGFADVFKKCWHGPEAFGDLLPNLDEFVKRYDLQTASGTFNEEVC
eukprot:s1980_g3.t1